MHSDPERSWAEREKGRRTVPTCLARLREQDSAVPSVNGQPIVGAPASKWAWEAALLERSVAEGLTPTAQHIALLMSTFADGDGTNIRPTTARIQRVSGRGRATVFGALRELRGRGWILQVHRGAGVTKRASEYRLTIPPKVQPQALHQTNL